MKIFLRLLSVFFLSILSVQLGHAESRENAPHVLVSIKPLHSWVSAVMEGVGTPELLIKGSDSVHGYSLKPSDAKSLAHAQVVFIVDPEMESFLTKPLKTLASKAEVVSLSKAAGVHLLHPRHGGMFEAHHHGDDKGKSHKAAHDMHFWLDPENAIAATIKISQTLSKVDPKNKAIYEQNAQKYIERLKELEKSIKTTLSSHDGFNFIVFHDGYHYFENRFGVHALGSITIDPERQPGARRIKKIRDKISKLHAVCVFTEPQFKPAIIATIIEGTRAKSGALDPLGASIPAGKEAYTILLQNITDSMIRCDSLARQR